MVLLNAVEHPLMMQDLSTMPLKMVVYVENKSSIP